MARRGFSLPDMSKMRFDTKEREKPLPDASAKGFDAARRGFSLPDVSASWWMVDGEGDNQCVREGFPPP